MGVTLPECGFLVVKDGRNSSAVPALIGMNIISRCRQLVHAEFDTTLGGELEFSSRCKVSVELRNRLLHT